LPPPPGPTLFPYTTLFRSLGTALSLLSPALLPFLRGQLTLTTLPPALLGVVDHRSDPDLPALAALPHCAGITRLVLIAALAPAVPIRKRRFTKFGLNAGGHLPPHVPFIGADMGQQVRQLIEFDIRKVSHDAPPICSRNRCSAQRRGSPGGAPPGSGPHSRYRSPCSHPCNAPGPR